MLIYVNGSWVSEAAATIPLGEMGFLYGDSLFETIRVNSGVPFRMEKHLERLQSGMSTIRMVAEEQLQKIPQLAAEFIRRNDLRYGLLRVIITRGTLQGIPWGTEPTPNLYITAREFSPLPDYPVKVVFYPESEYPILRFNPAIKSGNYLGNLLAKKDAEAEGAYEPVFVNKDGIITECAIRNIFFIKDKVLMTPSTDLGILPGVVRDTVMELATESGLQVEEAAIDKSELEYMDEAFITSTGVGVLPVTWPGFTSDYKFTLKLRSALLRLWK